MSTPKKPILPKTTFEAVFEAVQFLKTKSAGACATYSLAVDKLTPATYAPQYIEKKRAEARAEARTELEAADITFHAEMLSAAEDLKTHIRRIVTKPIPADFLANVRAYQDFGLDITTSEIRAFAALAEDCYPALRVLCKVADGAGLHVSIPQIADLEKDIAAIEQAAELPTLYIPADYDAIAGDVLPRADHLLSDAVILDKEPGRVSGFDTVLRRQQMERFEASLDEIKERWSLPCIITESSETVSETNESSSRFADALEISEKTQPVGVDAVRSNANAERQAADNVRLYM